MQHQLPDLIGLLCRKLHQHIFEIGIWIRSDPVNRRGKALTRDCRELTDCACGESLYSTGEGRQDQRMVAGCSRCEAVHELEGLSVTWYETLAVHWFLRLC